MEHSWLFIAFVLGAVEGLTEFLPVSSTGHLILAGELLDFVGEKANIFEVVIQLGAIFAVVVLYWPRFWGLLAPLVGRQNGPALAFSGWRGLWLLFLTTLPPCIAGLALHSYIKTLFSPLTVAAALAVGALCMLLVEHWGARRRPLCTSLDEVTPRLALGIGCCQCLALWPGFSRSAATIMGGMLLGAQRKLAAEYSFIAAVPLMVAATGYDLLKAWHLFSWADAPLFVAGSVFSFLFAWAAVKSFIALMGHLTLRPFAYYRLVVACLVIAYFM